MGATGLTGDTPTSTVLGKRYRLLHKLGEGGMGSVYRAFDRLLRQPVALKRVIASTSQLEFTTQGPISTSADTGTFAKTALAHEFQLLAGLHHPHVINVIDYGFDAHQQPFFTMTLLEGARPITHVGRDQPLHAKMQYVIAVLQALMYLHQRGIIHRDLKPDNALVTPEGIVQVLDFGIAVKREQVDLSDEQIAGTLAYIAPEVLRGAPASESSDLYAVGVIAYELLAGQHPYKDSMMNGTLINAVLFTEPAYDVPGLDPTLLPILMRLLAKQPEDRYLSAAEVVAELCAALDLPIPKETADIRASFLEAAQFVGREREFSQLAGALSEALEGRGSAWLIGGESGVGKSRLVNELRAHGLVKGALVLHGQGVTGGGLAYQLWREPLRRLLLNIDLSDLEAGVLKPVVPDLDDLLDRPIPDAPPLEGRAGQQRLLDTIVSVFRRSQEPVLVLLEDLQWTVESLDVLRELVQSVAGLPLLIVGNYRDDERPGLPDELPGMQVIKLARLDSDAIEALSASMLGEVGRQYDVVDLLLRETEGNAFFLVEVVRALAEGAGSLSDIGRVTLPRQVFAGGVQQVIQRRLDRVPADAQALLKLAAVIGRQLDLDVLRAVEPDRDLDEWLVICSNAAVLEVSDEVFRFAHDKLREGVLAMLTEGERRALRKLAAVTLERIHAGDADEYAAVISDHYEAAGELSQAATWYYRAGRDAQLKFVPSSAIDYYRKALDYWKLDDDAGGSATPAAPVDRLRALDGLGRMLTWMAQYAEASQVFSTMQALAEQVGDSKALAQAWLGHSTASVYQGNLRGAQEGAAKAEQIANTAESRPQRARALFLRGWSGLMLGDLESALTLGDQALALNRELDQPMEVAQCINLMGTVNMMLGRYAPAGQQYEEALRLFQQLGQRASAAALLNNLGQIAEKRGDFNGALERYQEALAFVREVRNRDGEMVYLNNIGGAKIGLGQFEEAEMDLQDVIFLAGDHGFGQLSETYRFLAESYLGQSKLLMAERTANKALILGRGIESLEYQAAAWRLLGQVAARLGEAVRVEDEPDAAESRTCSARDCFTESNRLTVESGMKGEQAQTLRAWAKYEIEQGDRERGRALLKDANALFVDLGVAVEQDARARL